MISTSLSRIAIARAFNKEEIEDITKSVTLSSIDYDSKEFKSKQPLEYDSDVLLKTGLPQKLGKEDRLLMQRKFKKIINNTLDLKELKYSYFDESQTEVENALGHSFSIGNDGRKYRLRVIRVLHSSILKMI